MRSVLILLIALTGLNAMAQDYKIALTQYEYDLGAIKQVNGEKVDLNIHFVRTDKSPSIIKVKYTIKDKKAVCLDSYEQSTRGEPCLKWGIAYVPYKKTFTLDFYDTLPLPKGVTETFTISFKQKSVTRTRVIYDLVSANGYYNYEARVKRNSVLIEIPY